MATNKSIYIWNLFGILIIAAWLLGFATSAGAQTYTLKCRETGHQAKVHVIEVGDVPGTFDSFCPLFSKGKERRSPEGWDADGSAYCCSLFGIVDLLLSAFCKAGLMIGNSGGVFTYE